MVAMSREQVLFSWLGFCEACVLKPPVCTQNTRVPMPRTIEPATARRALPSPVPG